MGRSAIRLSLYLKQTIIRSYFVKWFATYGSRCLSDYSVKKKKTQVTRAKWVARCSEGLKESRGPPKKLRIPELGQLIFPFGVPRSYLSTFLCAARMALVCASLTPS